LANAGSTGVSEDNTTNTFEGVDEAITGNGSTDLLGTRGNGKLGCSVETMISSFTGNGSRSGHILVGGVGARTDETDFELFGPVVLLDLLGEFGNGGGQVRSERTVDVGLQLREVLRSKIRMG
jgi:hypothetical protein